MSVTLFIDTSQIHTVRVRLMRNKTVFEIVRTSQVLKSQMVLPLIEEILREHNLNLTDISAIELAAGPGSFTGLRVGAAVANTLAYLLDVPVNGNKKLVKLTY